MIQVVFQIKNQKKIKKTKIIFRNIISLYCNNEICTLFYNPFPETINTYWVTNEDNMYIIDVNNNKIPFSWGDYLSLVNEVVVYIYFYSIKNAYY
jgi:hypothetical protein